MHMIDGRLAAWRTPPTQDPTLVPIMRVDFSHAGSLAEWQCAESASASGALPARGHLIENR
jgi:hypothetical protein